jgi:signal transduction histidine kinase
VVRRVSCDLTAVVRTTLRELETVQDQPCVLLASERVQGKFDAVAVRRAVENLLTNAFKYGDRSSPVTVSIRSLPTEVEIAVHNRGNAIPAAELSTLFQWHRRTASAVASGEPGWGLGLMVVKGIAEAHGGTVRVESDTTRGTTFTFSLLHV